MLGAILVPLGIASVYLFSGEIKKVKLKTGKLRQHKNDNQLL
jgi:hypothetical protein